MLKSKAGLLIALIIVANTLLGPASQAVERDGFMFEWEGPVYKLIPFVGRDGQTYARVEVEEKGYVSSNTPGWPSLPSLGRLVVLPPEGDFGLELIEAVYDTVSLDYPVEPALTPDPVQFDADGRPLPRQWTFARDETAYTLVAPYPADWVTLGDVAWMRDHRLARLTFYPFRYHPAQQTLDIIRRLRVRVWWEPSAPATSIPVASTQDTLDDVLAGLVLNSADLNTFRAQDRTQVPILLRDADTRELDETGLYRRSPQHSPALQTGAAMLPQVKMSVSPYKVLVETEGIYALDYPTLATAGLPVGSIDPATLRLTHAGSEIAAQWEGDDSATFEDGERLLFYARPQLTRYAGYDVYWLSWGGDAGRRMVARSGDPTGLPSSAAWTTLRVEENVEYDSLYQGQDGDRWFWRRLKLPDILSGTLNISLDTPVTEMTGEMVVWLQGFTHAAPNPDHHVRFGLNGQVIGDASWEGKTAYTVTLDLPTDLLDAGDNEMALSLPGDTGSNIEGVWLDAIAITYPLGAVSGDVARFSGRGGGGAYTIGGFSGDNLRAYDVTDPSAPLIVTDLVPNGGVVSVGDVGNDPVEYLILTDSRIRSPQAVVAAKPYEDPSGGADYIIITHPSFETALAPLVAQRVGQELRVELVDVEAIYDQFGDGRMDPQAIRVFLSHAYANWPAPAPQYVLLVGDGTYDPRGYRLDSAPTYLPPYLADVDPDLGETASDHQYADLTGDRLPDLRLGRLPVNTAEEVGSIVSKIIQYENNPPRDGWNKRLVFGADNPSDAGDHQADADGEFYTYATPEYGYQGTRVYLNETAGDLHLYPDAQAAQDALIAALNQGALIYTYFGHASWHQEAVLETDNYAPLFHLDHIARLDNQRRWPLVLHMTCLTGLFIHPVDDTLDESLLRADGVGAIAVWGSSGFGVARGHRVLHQSFYQSVFDNGQAELGAATHAALASLYASGMHYDLIDTYHLFGDPALVLNKTIEDLPFSIFLPIIEREF